MELTAEYLLDLVERALKEDVETGDATTEATVDADRRGRAVIIAKSDGLISGLDVAALVFYRLDSESEFTTDLVEGSRIRAGDALVEITGKLNALLTGERTALNFLMHLSGIATQTARFVDALGGTRCRLLDTRKTTPGLRLLEKRAVHSGGGENHRIGLFDMILIKNNHITAAGSLEAAVKAAVEYNQTTAIQKLPIEIEVRDLDEVRQAIQFPIDRIMLDNFSVVGAEAAVKEIRAAKAEIEIEASGNITLENAAAYGATGVDFISVGAVTHSVRWLDLSMSIKQV